MKQIFTTALVCVSFLLSSAQVILTGNPIVTENSLPGNPISEWGVPDFRDNRIAGFTTKMSLNSGETVRFKITVQDGADYTLKIYRIGYYGGDGARLVADLGVLTGVAQPAGISDPVTGKLDCDNWSESASWNIPSSAVSGLYVAKVERSGGGSNHIVFIVRNDASHSDLYLQFPDANWQAYNGYGGNNLYDGTTAYSMGHAVKVSYNRPMFPYNSLFNLDGRGADWYMNAEYPMIRWLERNGYDVTYTSCNDIAKNGGRILNHKVFISIGHDEYWSKNMRDNVEAARDAGVHLAFFSGNEVYWKTRWEDNDGTEDRTLVCYKEGLMGDGSLSERVCGTKCDGSTSEWTGLWRTGAEYDGGKPENMLTGQISWTEAPDAAIKVPSFYQKLRFWRHTSIPSLLPGETALLGSKTLGYEWDYEQYEASYPHGRITLSSTTLNGLTHKLSLYRHASGALVFGAGTIQWSWGLDGQHYGGTREVNKNMQQATVNLFADMGVQPYTLQGNLIAATASTDYIAPTSTITAPSTGSSFPARAPLTITGTATDASVVAGIEVSVDGGTTWKIAEISELDGTVSWAYTWSPAAPGVINVRSRGYDDSGNIENAGTGITLTITAPGFPFTIFEPTDLPARHFEDSPMELGMKFRANMSGYITGIRFYKGPNNSGTHLGNLWASDGTPLATVIFTNETLIGWQEASFSTPVAITEGETYVASYYTPSGNYSTTTNFFTAEYPAGPASSWPLQALANSAGGNGVFAYGSSSFPTSSNGAGNYYVDVVFTNTLAVPATLNGTVVLQGRPAAPHASWQVPVQVDLYASSDNTTPVFSTVVNTDQNGTFTIADLPLGTYTVSVKNVHTLKRVKHTQTIVGGNNNINFGTLLEGDVSGDNFIILPDLSIMVNNFNKIVGNPGVNGQADLNNDGYVTLADVSLLINNFNKAGETP